MPESPNDESLAIKLEDLRMVYNPGLFRRNKIALRGLDLEVPKGSIYGFLGQNGAGKTTAIKILVGLQQQTSGNASILGVNTRESEARLKVGFMPENPYFYEYLTAMETMEFYGQLSGMGRKGRKMRSEYLLEVFGLGHARNIPMRDFSKGMRQRLGLAQAMLHEPPVLILDEPMSGLDPLGRRQIRDAILEQRDKGRTVFFSSHVLGDVADICDRVCVLHLGRKIVEGPLQGLLSDRVLDVVIAASGVSAEGLPEVAKLARRTWHDGQLYHALIDGEEKAQQAKDLIEKAGGTLRQLMPHRESLEEYFVRITKDGELLGIVDQDGEEKGGDEKSGAGESNTPAERASDAEAPVKTSADAAGGAGEGEAAS